MTDREVGIIKTGIANTASVAAAVRRAGGEPTITRNRDEVARLSHVVLPGVGSFGAGMHMLEEHALVDPLKERIQADRPLLCICLGLQLLCESSDESPGVVGLQIIDRKVTRFPEDVRVPQFGWNRVDAGDGCSFLCSGFAYFANSYRLEALPSGWSGAESNHGGSFVAAFERSNLLACQFHLELSGKWGQSIFDRWLKRTPG